MQCLRSDRYFANREKTQSHVVTSCFLLWQVKIKAYISVFKRFPLTESSTRLWFSAGWNTCREMWFWWGGFGPWFWRVEEVFSLSSLGGQSGINRSNDGWMEAGLRSLLCGFGLLWLKTPKHVTAAELFPVRLFLFCFVVFEKFTQQQITRPFTIKVHYFCFLLPCIICLQINTQNTPDKRV